MALRRFASRRYSADTGERLSDASVFSRWSPSAEARDIQGRIDTAKPLVIAGAVAAGGVILGGLAWLAFGGKKASPDAPVVDGAPSLSPRRVKALALAKEVLPSKWGSPEFTRIAPGYDAAKIASLPAGFTTCGYFVCFIAVHVGLTGMITTCGTNGVRDAGKKAGAWFPAGVAARPRPGDFYCIINAVGGVIHVGMIISVTVTTDGEIWRTGDAGQGGHGELQEALYVDRIYDPVKVTLGGRPLGGWDDLDLMTPLAAA